MLFGENLWFIFYMKIDNFDLIDLSDCWFYFVGFYFVFGLRFVLEKKNKFNLLVLVKNLLM